MMNDHRPLEGINADLQTILFEKLIYRYKEIWDLVVSGNSILVSRKPVTNQYGTHDHGRLIAAVAISNGIITIGESRWSSNSDIKIGLTEPNFLKRLFKILDNRVFMRKYINKTDPHATEW